MADTCGLSPHIFNGVRVRIPPLAPLTKGELDMNKYEFALISEYGEHICNLTLNEEQLVTLVNTGLEVVLKKYIGIEEEQMGDTGV